MKLLTLLQRYPYSFSVAWEPFITVYKTDYITWEPRSFSITITPEVKTERDHYSAEEIEGYFADFFQSVLGKTSEELWLQIQVRKLVANEDWYRCVISMSTDWNAKEPLQFHKAYLAMSLCLYVLNEFNDEISYFIDEYTQCDYYSYIDIHLNWDLDNCAEGDSPFRDIVYNTTLRNDFDVNSHLPDIMDMTTIHNILNGKRELKGVHTLPFSVSVWLAEDDCAIVVNINDWEFIYEKPFEDLTSLELDGMLEEKPYHKDDWMNSY